MVALGDFYATDVCEVINMNDATLLCPNLSPYPYGLRLSTGHVVDKVPIIAGGYSGDNFESYVYKHDRETNSWISLGNMATPRNQFTSVPLNGALWVLGGYTHCEYKAQKFRAKLTKLVRTCGDFVVI